MITVWAMEDVLSLPSVDSDGACMPTRSQDWSVESALAKKSITGEEYEPIRNEIENDGINRVPVHVDLGRYMREVYNPHLPDRFDDVLMMGNGHHRLLIMLELGLDQVRVTDLPSESTDDPRETGQYDPEHASEDDQWNWVS